MGVEPGHRRLAGRRLWIIVAAVLVLLLATWIFVLPRITVRGEVAIVEAELRSPGTLALVVDSCGGDPRVSSLRLTDREVRVRVEASSTPFSGGGDCQDVVEVELPEPLGDRSVVDTHSGQPVVVTRIDPVPG